MKLKYIIAVSMLLIAVSGELSAQKNKRKAGGKAIYAEFQEVSQWYKKLPFQMDLSFKHSFFPVLINEDSSETIMKMYYGTSDCYMIAEGIEQIANDSLLVLVNMDARMITIYPGAQSMRSRLEQSGLMIAGDSVKKTLLSRFDMSGQDVGEVRRIYFTSLERIGDTKWSKEELSIYYNPGTKTPVLFEQVKRMLIPVDSADFESLKLNSDYLDRCLRTTTENGDLYFIIRDQRTSCRYSSFSHETAQIPVRPDDRVVRQPDGTYRPAKGYEEYMVSIEY